MRIKPLLNLSLLLICLVASCAKPPPGDQAAPATLATLETDCRQGDSKACLKVASAYYQGHGVKRSYARASALFGKACQKGAGDGCFHLANMLELGRGVKKDLTAAIGRYTEACKHKVGPGCYRVGKYYHQAESGQQPDFARSAAFFKKACDIPGKYQGESCFFVGTAFGGGKGLPRSLTQCAAYMRKSCKLDDRNGCAGLAAMMESGMGGVKRDLTEARRLYQKACDGGVLAACGALKKLGKGPATKARPRPVIKARLRPVIMAAPVMARPVLARPTRRPTPAPRVRPRPRK